MTPKKRPGPLIPPTKLLDENAPFRYVPALREEVAKVNPPLREKLVLVLAHLESWATFWASRRDSLLAPLSRLSPGDLDPVRDPQPLRRLRDEYLAIIRNHDESMHVRYFAGGIMARAVESSPAAARVWSPSLIGLLREPDPAAQVVAVGAVLMIDQRKSISKSRVILPLIRSLRDSSFPVRQIGQNLLECISGKQACIDATDSADAREPSIRQWEAWGRANQSRLKKETLE